MKLIGYRSSKEEIKSIFTQSNKNNCNIVKAANVRDLYEYNHHLQCIPQKKMPP